MGTKRTLSLGGYIIIWGLVGFEGLDSSGDLRSGSCRGAAPHPSSACDYRAGSAGGRGGAPAPCHPL